MESSQCKQRTTKVSLAEILRCFEHPISEEQAWAICFQCCRKMEQLAQGLCPQLHSVFIKGFGSVFIHADGTVSFKVFHKSDAGGIEQSEDKLLEHLGMVIYEALDWGINSQVERELSEPLERLLCFMLKLDDEAMKPAVTLQDVIKACEEHSSRPSEATSHYEMTCRNLFTEYLELQEIVTTIQTCKERLRKMSVEDLGENPLQKKEKHWALQSLVFEISGNLMVGFGISFSVVPRVQYYEKALELAGSKIQENGACYLIAEAPWPSLVQELQNGVRLRKATERPCSRAPPKEIIRSPYELLLDDVRHKKYTLRKVIIKQNHKTPDTDVAAPKPHLKPVLERKLEECAPQDEQLMAEIKPPQKLQSAAARGNGSRPKETLVTTRIALKSPGDGFSTLQDASTQFRIVNTTTQQLGPGVQEITPKLPSSCCLASARSPVASCNSTGLASNCTCPPMSAPALGDVKPSGFPNAGQQHLPPCRGRSKSLEPGLQSEELDCPFPDKWPSPTIAELIGTRYAMMVLEGQGFFQGISDVVFSRAKVSMPFRMSIHLPLHFLKLLRLSREEDSAIQEQMISKLLHEIEHWECFGVPVTLEPRCLAQPLCCYAGTMADWQTVDVCMQCEQYLLNVASSQQQSIRLRRISWP